MRHLYPCFDPEGRNRMLPLKKSMSSLPPQLGAKSVLSWIGSLATEMVRMLYTYTGRIDTQ